MKKIKGYKVMNPDMTCLDFKYEVGKTYKHEGDIDICRTGFHFCKELKDCYNYYSFDHKNVVCEVEGGGQIIEESYKLCVSELKIVRRLSLEEILDYLNIFTSSNRGSYNRGSSNSGSYNRGSDNSGSDNRGSDNSGSDNRGSYNRGSYNRGSDNRGSYNSGSYNRGSDNSGSDNRGSYNRGSYNRGSDNSGSYNRGSDNSGSDNRGSYNSGSYNRGSDNRGIYNFGSYSVGTFNTVSFIGTKESCYCFNVKTNLSLIQFYRKYMTILKEIKNYDFTNVNELPGYTEKKWNQIFKHI